MKKEVLAKVLTAALSGAVLASTLVGCGGDAKVDQATTGESKGEIEQVDFKNPKNNVDKVFRYTASWPKPPLYQGNPWANQGIGTYVDIFMHERLFAFQRSTDDIVYRLAESIEHNGNVSTIKLRQGVKWHDGTPFTSKDIWAYYMLDGNSVTIGKMLAEVNTPDDQTVEFVWVEPAPSDDMKLLYLAMDRQARMPYHIYKDLVDEAAAIFENAPKATADTPSVDRGLLNSHLTKEVREQYSTVRNKLAEFTFENPIGTGPFKFVSVNETKLKLEKFEEYWDAENVNFEKVEATYVADDSAKIAMMQSGEIDWMQDGDGIDIIENLLNTNKDLIHYKQYDPAGFGIFLNTEKAPFDDKNVRKAAAHVLERDKIRDVVNPFGAPYEKYSSLGIVANTLNEYVDKDVINKMYDYSHNTEKAEALLTESGWTKGSDGNWRDKDGVVPEILIGSEGNNHQRVNMAQIAAEQLTKFGLPTKVIAQDGSVVWTNADNGDFHAITDIIDVTWNFLEPYFPLRQHFLNARIRAFLPSDENKELDWKVPGPNGNEIDVYDAILEYQTASDERKKEIVNDLVYISNEECFAINFYQGVTGVYVNGKTIGGDMPLADQFESQGRNMMPPDASDRETTIKNNNWNLGFSHERVFFDPNIGPK